MKRMKMCQDLSPLLSLLRLRSVHMTGSSWRNGTNEAEEEPVEEDEDDGVMLMSV